MNDPTPELTPSTDQASAAPTTGPRAVGNYVLFCLGGAAIFGLGGAGTLSVQNAATDKLGLYVIVLVVLGALFGAWMAHQRNRGKGGF